MGPYVPPQIHEAVSLVTRDGQPIDVDVDMVLVIEGIWHLGYETRMCCQDIGQYIEWQRQQESPPTCIGPGYVEYHRGFAWIKMPVDDARGLLDALALTSFRDRVTGAWREDSWRTTARFSRTKDERFDLRIADLHFPADQISDLATVLLELGSEKDL